MRNPEIRKKTSTPPEIWSSHTMARNRAISSSVGSRCGIGSPHVVVSRELG
jgi:hypothetical protein